MIGKEINDGYLHISRRIEEYLRGIKYIKVLNLEAYCFDNLTTKVSQILINYKKKALLQNLSELIVTPILILGILVFLFYSSVVLMMPFATIMVYLLVATRITPLLPILYQHVAVIKSHGSSFIELQSIIKDRESVIFKNHSLHDLMSICLNNITMRYGERTILEHINYSFVKGNKYALIGESGSGKSTLVDLCLKLMTPSLGDVTYFQDNNKELDGFLNTFYLTQNPVIIEGTVRDNLYFGRVNESIQDIDLWDALSRVGLESTFKQRDGLETWIEHDAKNISVGQKQRLAHSTSIFV